ncbi:MAG: ATP-binding protein [Flavobacteriales bacterium]|nr:ATP-binding protein [Flavobacteriales bacterium]
MINKRLLIKNLLAYNNENSFYDKKRLLDLDSKEGKSKFLKHICALSNANPYNNSYIIIGVEDEDNALTGVEFFDDSKIQNIVNAYLDNPPKILYENIHFPNLPKDRVLGLVTISPNQIVSSFKKSVGLIPKDTVYYRMGSMSMPVVGSFEVKRENESIVQSIRNSSTNKIKDTLDTVMAFVNRDHPDMNPQYIVFKEIFVLCWAGVKKSVKSGIYYSRVDIELINEQVRLFYSALDEVSINFTEDAFEIIEYISAKIKPKRDFFPFEKVSILFSENGDYSIQRQMLFEKPQYDRRLLQSMYAKSIELLAKIKSNAELNEEELKATHNIASTLMICHIQNYPEALHELKGFHNYLKEQDTYKLLPSVKGALRILRKLKYEVGGEN